jgi:cobalt/nickel transport protein
VLLLAARPGAAHYHILLPDKASVERDTPVRFTLRFGHPFEHQMFRCQKPEAVTVLTPSGRKIDLAVKAESDAKGETVEWTYKPAERGDHVMFVRCRPEWMAEEKLFLEDGVKVILHVQTQNGWDAALNAGMELVPLTRPYGLRPGTVFQASVDDWAVGSPPVFPGSVKPDRSGTLVEVEQYNPTPPKELPPDEFITRTVKTDPNGVATVTLPEPGWWAITAVRDGGTRRKDGQNYPVKVRTTLLVPVDDKVPLTAVK